MPASVARAFAPARLAGTPVASSCRANRSTHRRRIVRTTSMSGPSPVALSIATPATLQPHAPFDEHHAPPYADEAREDVRGCSFGSGLQVREHTFGRPTDGL